MSFSDCVPLNALYAALNVRKVNLRGKAKVYPLRRASSALYAVFASVELHVFSFAYWYIFTAELSSDAVACIYVSDAPYVDKEEQRINGVMRTYISSLDHLHKYFSQ